MKKLIALLLALLMTAACCFAEDGLYDDEDDLLIEDIIEEEPDTQKAELIDTDGSYIITISCTGDFTVGGDTRKKKNIFKDELDANGGDINFTMQNTRDIFLQDDLTLVNFEGTLTDSTYIPPRKRENQFLFSAPPAYVSMLSDNGVEAVSLENNHIMDHGDDAYSETQQALSDAGIIWSNSDTIGVYEVKGIQIAMLSYLCIDRYDTLWDKVPADIKAAKQTYPLVIVSFHWGNEKDYAPTNNQIRMGRLAADAGADLVIGHHSHRINPIEYYNGTYICYSLGNFCFSGNSKPSDMNSYIFQIRFKIKNDNSLEAKGFRIIPIRISSRTDKNDFIPTPITKETTIDAILNTLKDNGKKLEYAVSDYPLDWK